MHGMVNNWQGEKKTSIPMRGDYKIQSLLSFFGEIVRFFCQKHSVAEYLLLITNSS